MIIELLKWFLIIWLTLSFIKIVLVWGQLLDFAQCYAEVFKISYTGKLIWDLALSTPVIILMTTPFLFFAEGW
ncbi:MAG: hypothetical protein SVR94_03070, partial [Pseudomonadota bacterium]|nr:hypothetical protein [Pseudomonadota bacterium]